MSIIKDTINNFEIIYFENDFWQKPVITEKQIFDNIFSSKNLPYNYIAFPWANYIDNQWIGNYDVLEKTIENEVEKNTIVNANKTYFTVIQHMLFRNYIDKLKKLNIKYIFTPHKMKSDSILEEEHNICIIPISLFPAQYNNSNIFNDIKNKNYLASFIGQINHHAHLTEIRKEMFSAFLNKPDCFIKANDSWFYQGVVYDSNFKDNTKLLYNQNTDIELYKLTMANSKFSLCPLGTGPNSIRFWESLSYGCIPILLSDNLILPEILGIKYDDFCIIWKETQIDSLYNYLLKFDDKRIKQMSNKCVEMYNNYFSINKIHTSVLYYFSKIFALETKLNYENKNIFISQYYKINSPDKNYNIQRQKEIDFCLQKNVENKYIDEIHLILENDYDLNFINNINNITIRKIITGKRINFKDVFTYSNDCLNGAKCILANSDIYIDDSIEILKNINFDCDKLFISLNRYEKNCDTNPPLLNGLEMNDAEYKGCQGYLEPFQESIWSQDTWIWKSPITDLTNDFNFNLGVVGCDNYINYLMYKLNYKVLNCSKIICCNHVDKLSIVNTPCGISKGNVSKKKEERIGNKDVYIFLENQSEIPDMFTKKIDTIMNNEKHGIAKLSFTKNVSEIELIDSQVIASSFSSDLYKPSNVLFSNSNYWEPDKKDENMFIQFNFEKEYDIVGMDITGKQLSRCDLVCGYLKKFRIEYFSNKWIKIDEEFSGIEINNANYIKKKYFKESITCTKIKICPLEYVNIKALKLKFYKLDYEKKDIFNFLVNNVEYFKLLNQTVNTVQDINKVIVTNKNNNKINNKNDGKYSYSVNILGEQIKEGICLFTYVMNRSYNIYNNINSWIKQKVDQIIILDWNSKEDMNDYVKSLNDERILYIRVINEKYFIRTFAQNLAARFCKFDKIAKIDSDIVLSDNFFENHLLKHGNFYVGEWRCARDDNEKSLHGNIYLFLNDYFRVNGYNEFIKDYGWDDSDFTIRLISCGLNKKLLNYDFMYHVPHDEVCRNENLLNHESHSLLKTYTNKFCLRNIIWNNNYKTQQFSIHKINKNLIICDRIKDNEYHFDETEKEKAIKEARELLISWKIL